MSAVGIRPVGASDRAPIGSAAPAGFEDAVDLYDIVADLESRGMSDRGARGAGYEGVFDLARAVHADLAPARQRVRRGGAGAWRSGPAGWWSALGRSALLLLGVVVLGLVSTCYSMEVLPLACASVAAWIAGQPVAAIVWRRTGMGDGAGATVLGMRWACGVGLAAGTIAVAVLAGVSAHAGEPISGAGIGLIVGAVAYAVAVAVLTVVGQLWSCLVIMAVAAAGMGVAFAWGDGRQAIVGPLAVGAVLALMAVAWRTGVKATRLTVAAGARGAATTTDKDVAVTALPTVQALMLSLSSMFIIVLGPAVLHLPPATPGLFLVMTLAGVVVFDPALVLVRAGMNWQITRNASLARARRINTVLILAALAAIVVFAGVLAGAVASYLGVHVGLDQILWVGLLYGAAVVTSNVLRSMNLSRWSLLAASITVVGPLVWWTCGFHVAIVVAACVLVAVLAGIVHGLGDPRSAL